MILHLNSVSKILKKRKSSLAKFVTRCSFSIWSWMFLVRGTTCTRMCVPYLLIIKNSLSTDWKLIPYQITFICLSTIAVSTGSISFGGRRFYGDNLVSSTRYTCLCFGQLCEVPCSSLKITTHLAFGFFFFFVNNSNIFFLPGELMPSVSVESYELDLAFLLGKTKTLMEVFFLFVVLSAGRGAQQFIASALWAGVAAGVMAMVKANGRQFCSRPRLCGLL